MSKQHEMSTANKLLMIQGISLMQDGMQFLEWMDDYKDTNTIDALTILRDRFAYFRECAFTDGAHDHLVIDKMKGLSKNIQLGYTTKADIDKRLNELRVIVRDEYNAENKSA
ncbi:hypothetical protein DHD32_01135 [Arenibacter sp. TNZ]|uniref:hypothetical protein n=1 Tax=Arenibacter TaxID=178469 RepID=UPI000CD44232|nr:MULTISPECIES: hypothetical protein [Arenibacter]MCM4170067.1 hypothetical protein [Arenibacter sp. TNZ]